MAQIERDEQQRLLSGKERRFGFIPLIAECHLGNRMASSFVERVNSAAKLLLGDKRACLSKSELGMTCLLRINRKSMVYMYEHHPGVLDSNS